MKHLKGINESTHKDLKSILMDLDDILMDLDDIGFKNKISNPIERENSIIIFISKQNISEEFTFTDEVMMVFLRLYNYLYDSGFKYTYLLTDGGKKLYVKGQKIRTSDIIWVDDKWPRMNYLKLTFAR